MATPPPPPESNRRLGRGLDALLGARKQAQQPSAEQTPAQEAPSALRDIPLGQIRPNRFQPRQEFRPEQLADLQSSLEANGLLQPITVRPASSGTGFELIAGERRYRAAQRLGWSNIAAIVKMVDDREALSLALVENLQRADLDPIEEAEGYERLQQEFNATQQQVADAVGKDRSTVANALRLLQLPASVRRMLQQGELSTGHARALLGLTSERAMADLARAAAAEGISVREMERRVRAAKPTPAGGLQAKGGASPAAGTAPTNAGTAETRRLEELLRRRLQTQVRLHATGRDQGELRIAFTSHEDLERLFELLGVPLDQ